MARHPWRARYRPSGSLSDTSGRTPDSHVSSAGDFVLDRFVGSGTTMLAASRTGRHSIDVEIVTQPMPRMQAARLARPLIPQLLTLRRDLARVPQSVGVVPREAPSRISSFVFKGQTKGHEIASKRPRAPIPNRPGGSMPLPPARMLNPVFTRCCLADKLAVHPGFLVV